jgi:hypothetical protein
MRSQKYEQCNVWIYSTIIMPSSFRSDQGIILIFWLLVKKVSCPETQREYSVLPIGLLFEMKFTVTDSAINYDVHITIKMCYH